MRLQNLAELALAQATSALAAAADKRFMIGIAGPPAAGKSTLAAALAAKVDEVAGEHTAIYVPMDGFHMHSAELARRGTLGLKGAPDTFDVPKLHDFLVGLKNSRASILAPTYSRERHDVVEDSYTIGTEPIVIVEGNYLFLDRTGWNDISALFDWRIYLDISEAISIERLFQRHMAGGKSREEAEQKIFGVDMKNFRLISATRAAADIILDNVP